MEKEKNDSVHAECPKHQGQPEIACVECRVEEKESTEVKYIDVKVFREAGFLQELNRQFLHPLGLALEVKIDDNGNERLGGIWEYQDDPEGIIYGIKNSDEERIMRFKKNRDYVKAELQKHSGVRKKLLGQIIEPI